MARSKPAARRWTARTVCLAWAACFDVRVTPPPFGPKRPWACCTAFATETPRPLRGSTPTCRSGSGDRAAAIKTLAGGGIGRRPKWPNCSKSTSRSATSRRRLAGSLVAAHPRSPARRAAGGRWTLWSPRCRRDRALGGTESRQRPPVPRPRWNHDPPAPDPAAPLPEQAARPDRLDIKQESLRSHAAVWKLSSSSAAWPSRPWRPLVEQCAWFE